MTTRRASAEGMTDLLRCPFCCGEVELSSAWFRSDGVQFWIECECGASIPGIGETLPREACIAAWNRRANPWVSVAERLPEDEDLVLIADEDGTVFTAYLDSSENETDDEQAWFIEGRRRIYDVTHWMPIPPLTPKEERG